MRPSLGYRGNRLLGFEGLGRRLVMQLYMAVTADKYELPRSIADSGAEMAKIVGITRSAVLHSVKRGRIVRAGWLKGCKIVRVAVDADE